jgi:cytochrome c oxidase subunit 2
MEVILNKVRALVPLAAPFLVVLAGSASAAQPQPWQMKLQPAASPVMERLTEFHNLILVIQVLIVLFVLGLLGYIIVRFSAKNNPVPSKTTHNTALEMIWTIVPILILLVIAVPSFKLLYFMDRTPNADMTLKVTGQVWSWTYQYPDHGGFEFVSGIVDERDLEEGQPRLLTVDENVVLPVDTDIRILLTSDDVIHAWAVPAFGVKFDAVAGRINETWVRIQRPGTYYGQCSELCGLGHGFMPIVVEAVSKQAFAEWVAGKKEAAAGDAAPLKVAQTGRAR